MRLSENAGGGLGLVSCVPRMSETVGTRIQCADGVGLSCIPVKDRMETRTARTLLCFTKDLCCLVPLHQATRIQFFRPCMRVALAALCPIS